MRKRAGSLLVALLGRAVAQQADPQPGMHLADSGKRPEVSRLGFATKG
jgi:hypothetical protein